MPELHLLNFSIYNFLLYFLYFRVMVKDPFHANCLPVHIGTLVELGKANGKIYTDLMFDCLLYFTQDLSLSVSLVYWFTLFMLPCICFLPSELFYLSHKLVDLYPNNPVSFNTILLFAMSMNSPI